MPALHTVQLAKIVYKLTADVQPDNIDTAVNTFLSFLQKKHMLSRLPHIIDAFEEYSKEVNGAQDIHITSALSLSKETISAIAKQLNAHASAEVEHSIDTSLIGGVVARKGNTIFDASIKTELERLTRSLN